MNRVIYDTQNKQRQIKYATERMRYARKYIMDLNDQMKTNRYTLTWKEIHQDVCVI